MDPQWHELGQVIDGLREKASEAGFTAPFLFAQFVFDMNDSQKVRLERLINDSQVNKAQVFNHIGIHFLSGLCESGYKYKAVDFDMRLALDHSGLPVLVPVDRASILHKVALHMQDRMDWRGKVHLSGGTYVLHKDRAGGYGVS